MTTLVLFDLDGTLLWTDGAGRRAIHAALTEVFGGTGPADYWFDGKTDPQIVRDLMRLAGHGDAHIDSRMERLLDRYVEHLERELADPRHEPRLCAGVEPLLAALDARDDIVLGLLTGNVAPGAAAKLRAVGIDPARFRVGAFGSDSEHRTALPTVARRRMEQRFGSSATPGQMVVIGDTPADIECGRSAGARTVGVATGRYSRSELEAHGAHVVLADFRDTAAAVGAILDD